MELRVLRYFLAVVEERNISHAAESMFVSQPTISRQLRDLEEELGVTLFQRGSRTIALTEAGEYLAAQARQILALSDKTAANIRQSRQITGSVLIGSAEAPMVETLGQAIHRLNETAPGIHVNIYSADASEVHTRINSGVFDFGVVMEPTDTSDYHFLRLPGKTTWGLLTRTDSSLAQNTSISAADLHQQRLITSRQHGSIGTLSDWFGSSDIALDIVATYNLLYNASMLTTAGVGSTICLDGIINTTGTDLTFIPLSPRLESQASLVWPKSHPLSPAAHALLDAIRESVPQIDQNSTPA